MADSHSLDLYIMGRTAKRDHPERTFAVKEERPGCLTIRLSSEVVQKLGILAGMDYAVQTLQGNTLVVQFVRKGAQP